MADSQTSFWSDNPTAPFLLCHEERFSFFGILVGAILYGVVVVLFFQCIGALFNRTRDVKWGLVAHTTVMFSFVTIYTAVTLYIQSISYVDNREFTGVDGVLPPKPIGYQAFIYSKAITVIATIVFLMNNSLADGLLLYRCYIIYSRNRWAVALPCVIYIASLAIGITFIFLSSRPADLKQISSTLAEFGIPYYSISFALNVLLTLMIVARLVLVSRSIRSGMNASVEVGGLYRAVVSSLIESCALYSVAFLLFIGSWAAESTIAAVFFPILVQVQTIAPFLITLRVANRRASNNVTVISRDSGPIRFRSPVKSTGTVLDGRTVSSTDSHGETRVKFGAGVETVIDIRRGG